MAEDEEAIQYSVLYDGEEEACEYLNKDGKAKVTYPNGDTFEGNFVNNSRSNGTYTFSSGGVYQGNWEQGKRTGNGQFKYPDGTTYKGSWKNNQRHGMGSYYYNGGDSYCGNWQDGLKHGFGTYVYSTDGAQLTGEWQEGVLKTGEWTFGNMQTVFEGSFENGQPIGEGIFRFTNENQINTEFGEFNEGQWIVKKHGIESKETKASNEIEKKIPMEEPQPVNETEKKIPMEEPQPVNETEKKIPVEEPVKKTENPK